MSNLVEKIEHVWSIICSASITDQESNNISLFNLLEQIRVTNPEKKEGKYKIGVTFELITRIRKKGDQGEIPMTIKITPTTEDGSPIGDPLENSITFPKESKNLRIRNRFNGLLIEDEGLHYLKVSAKTEGDKDFIDLARVPLQISFTSK